MATATQDTATKPAIAPYSTFKSKIRSFSEHGLDQFPRRVDKSLLASMSGTQQANLIGALRFFDLITADGSTTDTLRDLASSDDAEWPTRMRALIEAHYPTQLALLANGTQSELKESFAGWVRGASEVPFATRFLVNAAVDAGIPVAARLNPGAKTTASPTPRAGKPRQRRARSNRGGAQESTPPSNPPAVDNAAAWNSAVLEKFPKFDPSWPDDLKKEWFNSYKTLLAMAPAKDA